MSKKIRTNKGNVVIVEGVNFISSDSIVGCIRHAFETLKTPEAIASYIGQHYGQIPRNVFMASVNPENPNHPENKVVFTSF